MKKYTGHLFGILCFFLLFVLISCEKNNCDDPSNNIIESNSPVVAGWDINLEATSVAGGRFVWTGPNGWEIDYQTIASDANLQTVQAATMQASGEYVVKVYNHEGCLVSEGTTTVEVIAPPEAPCSIAANTSSSSVAGVGNYNFTSRNFSVTSSYYTVTGSAGGDYLRFGFWGQTRPKPGIYEIDGGYFGTEYGTTGLYIRGGLYDFMAQGGKVYVTAAATGKLTVAFCNVSFSNPLNPSIPITISARITEP